MRALKNGSVIIAALAASLVLPATADESQFDILAPGTSGSSLISAPQPGTAMCTSTIIDGNLGNGSMSFPSTSGTQTGRLNRNGVQSTCAAPKTCDLFLNDPGRAFDAYTLSNDSGSQQCVTVTLDVATQTGCNLQVNAFTPSFDDANLCNGSYLADPGLSSGTPPNQLSMSFTRNAGLDYVLVVHTVDPGAPACDYTLTVDVDVCDEFVAQPVPTSNTWLLALLGSTLGLSAAFAVRRLKRKS